MGHFLIFCDSCHDELRRTTFYEPPHEHQASPGWSVARVLGP